MFSHFRRVGLKNVKFKRAFKNVKTKQSSGFCVRGDAIYDGVDLVPSTQN